ncbi:hypothetical protein J2X36_003708 [Methylobacterium sp. BE186]|uniref:hypothetical protein n=1 Tax=Methylobacterium sp. BE186 TaxID=2817715 RepID=UPI00285A553A|nr:hypothetical protein [Methylobacterium sp. BE186]MDR7038936.1 hypothetical protein [Methylobacterium sp. BE186]
MRNPLSRLACSDRPKPALRNRADALKATAARIIKRKPVDVLADLGTASTADPHLAYRERILAAHAEHHDCRPIVNVADPFGIETKACDLVTSRMWDLADEVIRLPTPQSLEGLGVLALAQALLLEGTIDPQCEDDTKRHVSLVRAALSLTGARLPVGFTGFGDELRFKQRECAALNRVGRIPDWAMRQAQADSESETEHASPPAATPDLSTVPLDALFALADLYDGGARHFHLGSFWPKTGEHGPQSGKDLLIEEGDRLSATFDTIVAEIARREPADEIEADQQGEWRMRKALAGSDWDAAALIVAQTPANMERAFMRSEAARCAKATRA